MANIVPGAIWSPIDVGNRAARRKGRGLIGHIAVSNAVKLVPGPLATRSADWHFYLPKDPQPGGRFYQFIDLDLQSWSSLNGNATCPAFESQGGVGADVNAPWTANQVESAAIILAHLHRTEGVPLQDMVNSLPTSRGFAVHRYGIDPWRVPGGEKWSSAYGKTCPGDARMRQIPQIVTRAQQLVNGDDDMLDPELARRINAIYDGLYLGGPSTPAARPLVELIGETHDRVADVYRPGDANADPVTGLVTLRQETADGKTLGQAANAKLDALAARLPDPADPAAVAAALIADDAATARLADAIACALAKRITVNGN